jgi:MFS family permease
LAWLILGLYGLFAACTDGVGKAWISGLVPTEQQSTAQGIFQGATGFAVLSAGVWAGLLWGAWGQLPLLISGIAAAFFAAILLTLSVGARIRANSTARSTS